MVLLPQTRSESQLHNPSERYLFAFFLLNSCLIKSLNKAVSFVYILYCSSLQLAKQNLLWWSRTKLFRNTRSAVKWVDEKVQHFLFLKAWELCVWGSVAESVAHLAALFLGRARGFPVNEVELIPAVSMLWREDPTTQTTACLIATLTVNMWINIITSTTRKWGKTEQECARGARQKRERPH